MAHHIYRTQGIILRGLPDGEANKYLSVFTRELGLVGATARSVRDAKSKLRYGLQDYSISLVSLVRGKEVWRIINAVPLSNIYLDFRPRPAALSAAMRVLSLLRQLIAGEERHPELYDMAFHGIRFLSNVNLSPEELVAFELMFTLRALSLLGYAAAEPQLEMASLERWMDALRGFVPHIEEARVSIRKALEHTHLYT